ncbi:SubName: Full=Uncharacterized protein {ECO:0000313/EMBL:CCA70531.1} [Serendipita indica DSM 11827]|uniref:C2H2-type domain-containing protein n=1 Tax=Serendipita indica (strain DSM 11827) TaxID=1109443 RepID=G4TGT8_SERID|nr:SubName: Full=Uncharacterized protein {ECO:0000313/EMBL:CCA70531.1} [Serendipita indica DSM 11827]CCA70531.1 hypothetical protein PIIN_04468 [Serendipita indica DSM 11827]
MATPLYECRWKNCTREFDQKELLQAHIISHIDVHEPIRLRDLHDYRKAAGESTVSSLPFRYLGTQTSLGSSQANAGLHVPDSIRGSSATKFSTLGIGMSPAFSNIPPAPSLSSQIESALASGQQGSQPMRELDPMMDLAAPFDAGIASGTSSAVTAPMGPSTPPPTSEEVKLMNAFTKTPTPPPSVLPAESRTEADDGGSRQRTLNPTTPARKAVKRKNVGGVTFSEATPQYKKRKTIPKTPFPDSDDDADDDSETEETEARRAILEQQSSDDEEEDTFALATQIQEGYLDVEEILSENSLMGDMPSLQPEVETDESKSHRGDEEDEIRSQATSSDIRVEDVTPR